MINSAAMSRDSRMRMTQSQYPAGTAIYYCRLRMDTEERGAPTAVKEHDPLPREL